MRRIWTLLFMCLIVSVAYATDNDMTLGAISTNMNNSLGIFKHALTSISSLGAFYFIYAAVMQYLRHRNNPQESKLSDVAMYASLGGLLAMLGGVYHISALTGFIHHVTAMVGIKDPTVASGSSVNDVTGVINGM